MGAAVLSAPADADEKVFHTLRAAAALRGYSLARTDRADGPVTFYATRWNLVTELRTLADVAAFVARIGGTA